MPVPSQPSPRPDGGAQATPYAAQVVIIRKDGSEGGAFPVGSDRTDIGRHEGDIVLADDTYLSPRHARISCENGGFVLKDLGSHNGVYLRIRRSVPLVDGDMMLIGQQVLRIEVLSEAEQQLGPAVQHGVMVFGTPEIPRMARLVQYSNAGVARDVYYVYREHTVIGREQADIVFSDDPYMSRRHASITIDPTQKAFVLRDLTSSNGTAIRLRQAHTLSDGDQFRLGRHLFRFDLKATESGGHVLQ